MDGKVAFAAVLGLGLTACAMNTLSAQPAPVPKGYVVAEIDVTDRDAYRAYVAAAFPIIQKYGGRFLARGGTTIAVEGRAPSERVMIIEFASFEKAKRFEYSKEYTDIAPLRQKSADSRLFLVEGTPDGGGSRP